MSLLNLIGRNIKLFSEDISSHNRELSNVIISGCVELKSGGLGRIYSPGLFNGSGITTLFNCSCDKNSIERLKKLSVSISISLNV